MDLIGNRGKTLHIKTETVVGIFIIGALMALLYMTFQIGVFRIDKNSYGQYYAYFKDASGLSKKSNINIAGVKVGWIDNIELINDGKAVKTTLRVKRDCSLRKDAKAFIKQDGLLGNKYLDISPGSSTAEKLNPEGDIIYEAHESASIDGLLHSFKKISNNVEEITDSLKDAIVGTDNMNELKNTLRYFSQAASNIAHVSESLDRVISHNESSVNAIMSDVKDIIGDIKEKMPGLTASIEKLSNQLIEQTGDGFKNINEITAKINDGQGLLGKIINEDVVYNDIKFAAKTIRNSFEKLDRIAIIVDSHTEVMQGLAEASCLRDSKGYVNLRIHPCEDYFYLGGLTFSRVGFVSRETEYSRYFDEKNNEYVASQLLQSGQNFDNFNRKEFLCRKPGYRINLQFGKIFKDVAFRVGLFQGSFGLSMDYAIPFENDNFRWLTSLQAFDFTGYNRVLEDTRPHFKWLNKMFFTPNIYFVFGADDFISKYNKNAFMGAGLWFADDDLKYLLSRILIQA